MMIDELSTVSQADFKKSYINKGKPVIIKCTAEIAQACKCWSMGYLAEKQPEQLVNVAYYKDDKRYVPVPLKRLTMTLSKYTELARRDGNHKKYYLTEAPVDKVLPVSKNDILIPHFIPADKLMIKLLFVGIDTLSSARAI